MKQRLLAILLLLTIAMSFVHVSAIASENPPSETENNVQYSFDETTGTLTFSGNGVITSEIIYTMWKELSPSWSSLKKVVIGENISELQGYKNIQYPNASPSAFLPSSLSCVVIEIAGTGSFLFGRASCASLKNVSVTTARSVEIGESAFSSATIELFPLAQISKIGPSGLARAVLPVTGTKLNLTLSTADDFAGLQKTESIGTNALTYCKNEDEQVITSVKFNISGNVALGNFSAQGSSIFGTQITSATFQLAEGTNLVLHSGFGGSSSLKTLAFTGAGNVYFQHPLNLGNISTCRPLSNVTSLQTIDFSQFSGNIQFAEKMFSFTQYTDSNLQEVKLGENCVVTAVPAEAFYYCKKLATFDLSKVKGPIGEKAFGNTALSSVAELSGVTAIGPRAFDKVISVDWKNASMPANLNSVVLEGNDGMMANEAVWNYVQSVMENQFAFNQDGDYGALAPTTGGWEDSKTGEQNATTSGSTQLTKSAKWIDEDKTQAQVEIQAAYAPDQQMDFVFVLDTSDSMRQAAFEQATLGKTYEMISKTADVVDALLKEDDVDSHVAIISFGTTIHAETDEVANQSFFTEMDAEQARDMIRGLDCSGDTYYEVALTKALNYVQSANTAGRKVSVVFMSDGHANKETEDIEAAKQAIVAKGADIIGVLYSDAATKEDENYMAQACTEYYLATDTEGFSQAVNRTIYNAFAVYTLTDKINENFEAISDEHFEQAVTVSGGKATLSEDGRTITWDLSGTAPYQTHTMTIKLTLAKKNGVYPSGLLPTNEGFASLTPHGANAVPVNQVASPVLKRGSGSGETTCCILHYESNGGTEYADERYARDTVAQINKVPYREGYTFTGWYADKELTNRITEILMDGDKIVYAGWRASSVLPPVLNTKDHVAYVVGYPDGTVRPAAGITRAEVATIFFRLLTEEARNENWSQKNDYSDVKASDWFNNAVSTLSNMGVISGYPDGTFRPDADITRAEFVSMAVGFFKYNDADFVGMASYPDVDSDSWYGKFVATGVEMGLIEGYPDGTFRPEASITRAEACTLVNNTLGRKPDKAHLLPLAEMCNWPDNADTGAWYYAAVQEASNSHDYERQGGTKLEFWSKKLEDRDWVLLEKEWSDANSAPGGEVMDNWRDIIQDDNKQ